MSQQKSSVKQVEKKQKRAFVEQYKSFNWNSNGFTLSDSELKHLRSFFAIGCKHAENKEEYLRELDQTVEGWYRYESINSTENVDSTVFLKQLYYNSYRDTLNLEGEARVMCLHIPVFYLVFGMLTALLACIFTTVFVTGLITGVFIFNPFYMIILAIGFCGLFATDLVAYIEWRKTAHGSK